MQKHCRFNAVLSLFKASHPLLPLNRIEEEVITISEARPKKHPKPTPERESNSHVHMFITMTDVTLKHQHTVVGTTGPALKYRDSHVHRIKVRTSSAPESYNCHWHYVEDTTGPAMETPDGKHTHYFSGETSRNDGHKHCYSTVTDTSPDCEDCEEDYDDNEHDCDCECDCDCDKHHHR